MCIHVFVADDLPDIVVWDPDEVSVLVARGSQMLDVVRELRALLTIDLGAPEGSGTALLCFCGARLELPAGLAGRPVPAGAR
ncbi:hypothetical protein G3I38_30740 [Streptomyces sp. SID7958]|uniref:Uncharacterized protein n=2 Tax=unclassified Streptomyces TaxID=2593676 RepID=A0A6G3R1P3_9ACTN|nr:MULTISPECIES: hypothetical protein [unclassified Streptomyces]NEA89515.1 hypothetical protein [Streptomyces sp. SID14436]NEC83502.1 hypothetical protein [Streptomyces sp. SID7958]